MASKNTSRSQSSARKNTSRSQSSAKESSQVSAPALDLATAAEQEQVTKAQRIYVDVAPQVPTPDGALATVQREQRADESLGEFMLAEIRKAKQKGQPDSITRFPILRVRDLCVALGAAGVRVLPDIPVSAQK